MAGAGIAARVSDERAFDDAAFLGLARRSKRDPYRLGLFARHLLPGERGTAILPIAGGTLVATDRRLLHLTTHLEVDGAWNVREFTGYVVSREILLGEIRDVRHSTSRTSGEVSDTLLISTSEGLVDFLVSKGPARVVTDEDFEALAGLLMRRNPSRG